MQSAKLQTWCAHPAGMKTTSPGFWYIRHGFTPFSSTNLKRSARSRKKLWAWIGLKA